MAYDRFDTIRLDSNCTYFATILLLNETASPVDTISNEVLEETDDHLFCFTPSGSSASVTVTDRDGNNLPIGLQSTWITTSAGSGTMNVTLHHQPGIKNGDCALGETDVEVLFVVGEIEERDEGRGARARTRDEDEGRDRGARRDVGTLERLNVVTFERLNVGTEP